MTNVGWLNSRAPEADVAGVPSHLSRGHLRLYSVGVAVTLRLYWWRVTHEIMHRTSRRPLKKCSMMLLPRQYWLEYGYREDHNTPIACFEPWWSAITFYHCWLRRWTVHCRQTGRTTGVAIPPRISWPSRLDHCTETHPLSSLVQDACCWRAVMLVALAKQKTELCRGLTSCIKARSCQASAI